MSGTKNKTKNNSEKPAPTHVCAESGPPETRWSTVHGAYLSRVSLCRERSGEDTQRLNSQRARDTKRPVTGASVKPLEPQAQSLLKMALQENQSDRDFGNGEFSLVFTPSSCLFFPPENGPDHAPAKMVSHCFKSLEHAVKEMISLLLPSHLQAGLRTPYFKIHLFHYTPPWP